MRLAKLLVIIASLILSSNVFAAERFSVTKWGESLSAALQKNDTQKTLSLTDIKNLEKTAVPVCIDCATNLKLKNARKLFANGNFADSLKLYNEIPKGTDYWLQAVEERGWAYFRQDDFEKSLAQTKTLLSPQFVGVIDSEAFLLQSLSQLRLCDYQGVLETDKQFKNTQRTRIIEIQELMKTGTSEEVEKAFAKTLEFPLRYSDFGDSLSHLPLLFYRNLEVQKQLLRFKVSQKALSLSELAKKPTLQAQMKKINAESSVQLKLLVKKLAQQQNDENFSILQKINLVEVEAIQRIHTDLEQRKTLYKKNEFKKINDDQLVFMDDGNPWMDELDKYEVAAKACSKSIRRKM